MTISSQDDQHKWEIEGYVDLQCGHFMSDGSSIYNPLYVSLFFSEGEQVKSR